MSDLISCKVQSLREVLFEGLVSSVTYPNSLMGPTTVLKDHLSTTGLMKKGKIKITAEDRCYSYDVENGIFRLENNSVTVLLLS